MRRLSRRSSEAASRTNCSDDNYSDGHYTCQKASVTNNVMKNSTQRSRHRLKNGLAHWRKRKRHLQRYNFAPSPSLMVRIRAPFNTSRRRHV
ncbi:hypothetical protein Bpfe_029661 [Biomphalaria pfeifferi]|uniref:Uncharacterized protein n=1 Tax=Biomphalaria pfeifferi TaxID=112525 RepID=A0AAD8AR78_BIOPF|nr:hypothetical protein Bpfe_029661 [Biomphalaria pfeifferi]